MKKIITLFILFFAYLFTQAQSGTLLSPFGSKDYKILSDNIINSIAVQKDGRVVSAGGTGNGNTNTLFISRNNPNGSADSSLRDIEYHNGLYTTLDLYGIRVYYEFGTYGSALALQDDNKIIVGGPFGTGALVARLKANGDFDSSFGTNGKVFINSGASDIKLQKNGSILIAGNKSITRLLPNGAIDNSFGSNGTINTAFNINKIAIQADGDIVAVGETTIKRFSTTGINDASFHSIEIIPSNDPTYSAYAFYNYGDLAIQGDGKILIAASWGPVYGGYGVARLNQDGTIDTTFGIKASLGGKGYVLFQFIAINAWATSIAVQTDGKIIVGGTAENSTYQQDYHGYGIAKLLPTGEFDSSFGKMYPPSFLVRDNGRTYFGENIKATSMALTNNRIYMAGGNYFEKNGSTANITAFYNEGTPLNNNSNSNCSPIAVQINQTPAGSLYTLSATASGGQPAYSYQWNTGQSTQSITVAPGNAWGMHIEAENYKTMNGVAIEQTTDAGGGQDVGYIDPGDFMTYTVNIPTAATYHFLFRVACPGYYGRFEVRDTTGTVLATINTGNTNGYQNWTTQSADIALKAGVQTLKIISTAPLYNNWNINWIDIVGPPQPPSVMHVEAENWTSMSGVVNEPTSDVEGGQDVGYIDPGDYMTYNINIPFSGTYHFLFRVASPGYYGRLEVRNNSGTVLATVNTGNTNGYQNWTTQSADITLPAGEQTITIVSTAPLYNNWNLNWFEITGISSSVADRIQAENYSDMSGVATEPTTDAGGGLDVGYIDPGDYMDYKVSIPITGSYTLRFRVACPGFYGKFEVRNSTGTVLASVNTGNTNGYQNWVTVEAKAQLSAGDQVLRIVSTAPLYNNWNINWFEIQPDNVDFNNLYAVTVTDANGCKGYGSASLKQNNTPLSTIVAAKRIDPVNQTDGDLQMQVSPNPSNGAFTVQVHTADHSNKTVLYVYNEIGNIVEKREVNSGQAIYIGSNYTSGIYMAKLVQGNKQYVTRLIKLH